MSWLSIALLAVAVLILIGAEWPRLTNRFGASGRRHRERARRKAAFRIVRSESEEFQRSVEADLQQLPTIEEHDQHR